MEGSEMTPAIVLDEGDEGRKVPGKKEVVAEEEEEYILPSPTTADPEVWR
jgi:hypothetical protein